ncbi:MBL fold metallo-hydrolase RNA specificity domain-containing protein [Caldimonas sp. KR1-144]|uniref:MBL fold metallo-hydrolase RNA specificity domain-containing protein n=1 Tax=Caldimonas sp. KR1-144 TaxID=3400911 RepID=UPI003C010BA7
MQLHFLGATGTVTGSRYLVERGGRRLLVDCGLFQGLKQLRLRNWEALPLPASRIDAVVLTHAHIDHSGFLPRLIGLGFRGRVHCTRGTRELCELLLPDSGHLQEEEAEYLNRHGRSKHHPALPLYTEAEGRAALECLVPHEFGEAFEPLPGLGATFRPAGHILGAASVLLEAHDGTQHRAQHRTPAGAAHRLLFSGDLGRDDDLLMKPPLAPPACDTLVVESTYGDRLHACEDVLDTLAAVIARTAARGGTVVVPAFAVGRAQTLLHCIGLLKAAGRIPDMPVYLNSPMAADVTRLYRAHIGEHRLDAAQCARLGSVARIVASVEESRRLNELRYPSVIVSASGMASGGRVLHHLKAYAPHARNTVLLTGFQAMGTRGAALQAGATELRIHGETVPVRAEVARIDSLSAHADRDGLLAWIAALPAAPKQVFVTHGEPAAADALRQAVQARHDWPCRVPEYLEAVSID